MRGLGFNLDKFHLVGHSLGAQLVGQIGRTAKNSDSKYVFHRITGLDPAGPVFFPLNPFAPALSALDAEYVDIIHTDATGLGQDRATGHADFWPNAGRDQLGCPPVSFQNLFNDKSELCQFELQPIAINFRFKIFAATPELGSTMSSLSPDLQLPPASKRRNAACGLTLKATNARNSSRQANHSAWDFMQIHR